MSLHQREIQSRFIRHVSTLAKESSSGMIRINTTLTSHEQYGDFFKEEDQPTLNIEY